MSIPHRDPPPSGDRVERRAWLAAVVRTAALAGIAAMAAVLALRRGVVDSTRCPPTPCRQCAVWGACRLPRAAAAREDA